MRMSQVGTAKFLWRFARSAQDVAHEREVLVATGGEQRSATLFAPGGRPSRRPAWILLHGITVPGRHHDALRRMARSLAAAGHYAIAPEIPAWRALRVDPGETLPAVETGFAGLADHANADIERVGLIGFSVAGRWALSVAAGGTVRPKAVAAMGGYWDIERTLAAMVTGEHEWGGRRYRYDPDPYGRWIMGANLLPLLEDNTFGDAEAREQAAGALHMLASTAGQNGAMARSAVYNPLNRALRDQLPPAAHTAWDIVAPQSSEPAERGARARELTRLMARAAVSRYPMLSSTAGLESLDLPVVCLHGRADRLIPFTETLRLAENLPAVAVRRVTITRLFGHTRSREARPLRNPLTRGRAHAEFAETINTLLASLEQ